MTATVRHLNGWKRDLPDHRDLKLSVRVPVTLDPAVDLRLRCPAVYDQGHLGSCTANATGFLWHYEVCLEVTPKAPTTAIVSPSRLYIYYFTRLAQGTANEDSGGTLRGAMQAARRHGLCPETLWPYIEANYAITPASTADQNAIHHLPSQRQYAAVPQGLGEFKTLLAGGRPLAFGFSVPESFMSQEMASSGVMPLPQPGENVVGGHAVALAGYDDQKQAFLVRNSWGEGWGEGGYFWMPYAFATNPSWCSDFWTVAAAPVYT